MHVALFLGMPFLGLNSTTQLLASLLALDRYVYPWWTSCPLGALAHTLQVRQQVNCTPYWHHHVKEEEDTEEQRNKRWQGSYNCKTAQLHVSSETLALTWNTHQDTLHKAVGIFWEIKEFFQWAVSTLRTVQIAKSINGKWQAQLEKSIIKNDSVTL